MTETDDSCLDGCPAPSALAIEKVQAEVQGQHWALIERSPFCVFGTVGAGGVDVSRPRPRVAPPIWRTSTVFTPDLTRRTQHGPRVRDHP